MEGERDLRETGKTALGLKEIAARLNGIGVQWAVFAGAAAATYGVSRLANDIDILVPGAQGEQVAKAFPEAQVQRRENGSVELLSLVGCDVLAGLQGSDLDREMTRRLKHKEISGIEVPIISVEDNIAFKTSWGRGAKEGKRDWDDVEEMIRGAGAIDWEYLRWRVQMLCPKKEVAERIERLEEYAARYGLQPRDCR